MTPDYKSPLRATWVVPAGADAALGQLNRLTEGRVLFIEAEIDEGSAEALAKALGGALRAMVTVMGGMRALAAFADACALASRIDAVLLDADPGVEELRDLAGKCKTLSVGLWSEDASLARFSEALATARNLGLPLALPNPHAPCGPLSAAVRSEVAKAWRASDVKPAAAVHDLFLAEEMGLNPWKNYKGCAAGTALAHLRADGTLVACRTMPVDLGDLATGTLKELWTGRAARDLRERLKMAPEPCVTCTLVGGCGGGCPGLADATGRDASCGGCR